MTKMPGAVKKKRDELIAEVAGAFDGDEAVVSVLSIGFDAAWTMHLELVAPLIEALKYYGGKDPWIYDAQDYGVNAHRALENYKRKIES